MNNFFWLYCLSALLFFGRGMEDLPATSIFFYQKETLHLSASMIMYLGSIVTFAWMVKPFIGYMIDTWGIAKKNWIIIALAISSGIALFMGLIPHLMLPLLIGLMMVSSWNSAICNVTVDGLMCVEGKAAGLTGKIQSIQWGAITLASCLVGVAGGWLADHYHYQTAYLCLLPIYLVMIFVTLKYRQKSQTLSQTGNIKEIFNKLISNKELLWICLFLFLYNCSFAFNTPLMFIERDQWHWSRFFIGCLGTIGALAQVIGCWLYWKFGKRLNLNKWLHYGIWIGAANTLCYLYFTPVSCVVYDVIGSLTAMFLQLVVLDYMACKSLPGLESMSFALLCSVVNITSTFNTLMGGFLLPIIGLKWLIIMASFMAFSSLLILKKVKL